MVMLIKYDYDKNRTKLNLHGIIIENETKYKHKMEIKDYDIVAYGATKEECKENINDCIQDCISELRLLQRVEIGNIRNIREKEAIQRIDKQCE